MKENQIDLWLACCGSQQEQNKWNNEPSIFASSLYIEITNQSYHLSLILSLSSHQSIHRPK